MNWLRNIAKRPYKTFGKYKVFLVEGPAVRGMSPKSDEFTDFATHYDFKFVPKNEIWVENSLDRMDTICAMSNALKYLKLRDRGMDENQAYSLALKYTASIREKIDNIKKKPEDCDIRQGKPRRFF